MTLILLCTYDDGNIINSSRSDTQLRINDYHLSIKKWLKNKYINKYIIIENSGFISEKINTLIQDYTLNNSYKKIEFLQYNGQNFDRSLGKGFGVYVSLLYLIENSQLFLDSNKFALVTGRYYLKNFEKIILNSNTEIISDFQKKLSYAFNPLLVCSKKFITDYLVKALLNSNDLIGIHFEHCLASSVHRAIADGITWDLPCEVPIIEGISGTTNLPYYKNFFHRILILYFSKIKYFFFSFNR